MPTRTYAVLDFETTGLRAGTHRIIEVGVVLVRGGEVLYTFSQLMNPGHAIPSFITGFTGITNEMLRGQPSPQEVMPHLRSLLGDTVMVAHNAAFDQRFFEAEMALAGQAHQRTWLCSMRVARRLVPESRRHSLGALVDQFGIACPDGMQAHRALADALMTHELWQHLGRRARERLDGRHPSLEVLQALMSKPRKKVDAYFASLLADC